MAAVAGLWAAWGTAPARAADLDALEVLEATCAEQPEACERPAVDAERLRAIDAGVRIAATPDERAQVAGWARACAATCVTAEAREVAARAAELLSAQPAVEPEATAPSLPAAVDVELAPVDPGPGEGPVSASQVIEQSRSPLRGAVGATWAPGLLDGTYGGLPVVRGASVAVDGRVSWSRFGCVAARWAYDQWSVPEHATGLTVQRHRLELGWCFEMVAFGDDVVGVTLRPHLGVGLSLGTQATVVDGGSRPTRTLPLVGAGVHGRLDVSIRPGRQRWFTVVPWFGVHPYGRRDALTLDAARQPYGFMDAFQVGIGVAATLGATLGGTPPAR